MVDDIKCFFLEILYHQVQNSVYQDLDVLNEYLLNYVLDYQIIEYESVLLNLLRFDYLLKIN
jgi:hypothetical protein